MQYKFKLNKSDIQKLQSCCELCLNIIDDWEFSSLIGEKKCFVTEIVKKLGNFTYKPLHFLTPNDIWINLSEDEIRNIYSCLSHTQSYKNDPVFKEFFAYEDVNLIEVKNKITDVMERNDIFI